MPLSIENVLILVVVEYGLEVDKNKTKVKTNTS